MSAPILVVGAGPAGMSAALWLRDLELDFDWVDAAPEPGGTLRRVGNPIRNLVGIPERPGTALARHLASDCAGRGLAPQLGVRVARVSAGGDGGWRAELERRPDPDGDRAREPETWTGRCVLLCTGTEPRKLGLPEEDTLLGHGIEISVTRNLERYAGRSCIVVGGGDAALEGALLLAERCPRVHLVHRGAAFRAQRRFVRRVLDSPVIELHTQRAIARIATARGPASASPSQRVTGVVLDDATELHGDGVFVRIGVAPVVPAGLEGCRGRDGYLSVDARCRTALSGIYAAGDGISGDHQSVAWAIGSAGRAARAVFDDLFSD